MYVINTLLPIILLVGLGAFLRRIEFLSEDFFIGLNRLTFYIGLPCLLFYQISKAEFAIGNALKIFLVLMSATFIVLILGYLLAKLIKLPERSVGAFVQACFRCNTAFVGLPVIIYATQSSGHEGVVKLATLAMAPTIPIWNILSIIVLSRGVKGSEKEKISNFIFSSLTNPIVVACVIAVPFSIFSIDYPVAIERSLKAIGDMALPISLISIGSSLTLSRIRGNIYASILASVINVFVLPLIGWLIAQKIGMERAEMMITLILLACPAATASYIMAQQLGADEALAGSSVVISTVMSVVPLSIIVAIFK